MVTRHGSDGDLNPESATSIGGLIPIEISCAPSNLGAVDETRDGDQVLVRDLADRLAALDDVRAYMSKQEPDANRETDALTARDRAVIDAILGEVTERKYFEWSLQALVDLGIALPSRELQTMLHRLGMISKPGGPGKRPGRRGKGPGDGATWAGGIEHFLEDLWETLEKLTRQSGTAYGHDPTSRQFRAAMREATPSPNTIRKSLSKAHLKPRDIKSGKVTRSNYREFVGK